MDDKSLGAAVGERGRDLALAFVRHDHGPLGGVSRFRYLELDVYFDDLERLETEHGYGLGLHNLALRYFGRQRMQGTGIRFGLYDFKLSLAVERECHIGLRVITKRELLDVRRSLREVLPISAPVLDAEVLLTILLDRLIQLQLRCNSDSGQV